MYQQPQATYQRQSSEQYRLASEHKRALDQFALKVAAEQQEWNNAQADRIAAESGHAKASVVSRLKTTEGVKRQVFIADRSMR